MKVSSFQYYFFTIIITCLFQNCTVQKRIHQKGYYVSHKKHTNNLKSKNENSTPVNDNYLIAGLNNELSYGLIKKILPADTCGDILIFNDSTHLAVKVLEITDQIIKYKRCDNFNGPNYSTNKNKIATIVYSGGAREVFSKPIVGCKDSLILINGNTMLVAITDVTNDFVKYKSCNDLKAPERELNLSNIGRIHYSDGRVKNYNEVVITPTEKDNEPHEALKFIFGALLIGLGVAILLGLLTLDPASALLVVFYLLFIIFSLAFVYSMGWYQNMPFNPWFF